MLLAVLCSGAFVALGPEALRETLKYINFVSLKGFTAYAAAVAASLVAHESGHLIAALCMRFKVLGFALGPIRFSPRHGRFGWNFSARKLLAGAVSAIPAVDTGWRSRMLIVTAAGPLMTALFVPAAVLLARYVDHQSWLAMALSGAASLNLVILFVGLIPNGRFAAVRNDAQLFLCVWRNGDEASEIRLYHELMRAKAEGVRPRDYDLSLIAALTDHVKAADARPDLCLGFADSLSKWAIDRSDFLLAFMWHSWAVRLIGETGASANLVRAERACFELIELDRPETARAMFEPIRFGEILPASVRYRVRAAARLCAGDSNRATIDIQKALASISEGSSYDRFERDVLYRLLERSKSRTRTEEFRPMTRSAVSD